MKDLEGLEEVLELIKAQQEMLEILESQEVIIEQQKRENNSLQEQIEKLAKADLVLKENEILIENEKKSRKKLEAVKTEYEYKNAHMQKREQELLQKESKVENMRNSINSEIKLRVSAVESKIKSEMENKYRVIVWIAFIYGFVVTIITGLKSGFVLKDIMSFIICIADIVIEVWNKVYKIALSVSKLAYKLPKEQFAIILYWILKISVIGLMLGGMIVLAVLGIRRYIRHFKNKLMNYETVVVSLVLVVVYVFFGPKIKSIISINLLFVMIIIFVAYSIIRMVMDVKKVEMKKDILVGVVAVVLSGIILCVAWKWYGAVIFVVFPVAMLVVADGR